MRQRIAVIGAGIAGLSVANLLQKDADVTVFEKKSYFGGLISCRSVNGYLYHMVGGHVFNSKNKEVLNWFWSFFDREKEFRQAKRLAKVFIHNKFIGYPIEDSLFEFDREITSAVLTEISSNQNNSVFADNFEDFLKQNFGETLYNLYFKPYNEKIWHADLSRVPLGWLEGKLPMPNLQNIVLNNIYRNEEAEMVHANFYYPKKGGSQFIADRLAQNINCVVDEHVQQITIKDDGSIYINNAGPFNRLIYTGDVRLLPALLKGQVAIDEAIGSLRSNGTTNVLCACDKNDLSWLYIPEKKYKAHRIIYTGNFSPDNNADNLRSSCTVEFSDHVSEQDAREELKDLPGNLEFISYNYEPNSYVVQYNNTRQLINNLKSQLSGHQIYLLGRFAEWEYYNMDKVIESAFSLKEQLT